MAKRFGRNQKRRLTAMVLKAQEAELQAQEATRHAQRTAMQANEKLAGALRDQLNKGKISLEVEHFLEREGRNIIMHAIFDEPCSNLHYQYSVSPHELQIQHDREERERLGQYLGRAIADRLADAYAGRSKGSSRHAAD